jgi:hypothetical protein
MRPLNTTERARLRDDIVALTMRTAQQLAGERGPGEREVRLAMLAAARLLQAELGEQLDEAARTAAAAGADYGQIGRAAGMTRQGARTRWPGLAKTARAART